MSFGTSVATFITGAQLAKELSTILATGERTDIDAVTGSRSLQELQFCFWFLKRLPLAPKSSLFDLCGVCVNSLERQLEVILAHS